MNVSLTPELETIVAEKVNSGLYNNASEVVRDALRRAFCERKSLDLDEDTPELAEMVREGLRSQHRVHRKGDIKRSLLQFRRRAGK